MPCIAYLVLRERCQPKTPCAKKSASHAPTGWLRLWMSMSMSRWRTAVRFFPGPFCPLGGKPARTDSANKISGGRRDLATARSRPCAPRPGGRAPQARAVTRGHGPVLRGFMDYGVVDVDEGEYRPVFPVRPWAQHQDPVSGSASTGDPRVWARGCREPSRKVK